MEKDFYLNDRGLAAYFEKDWIDHVAPAELRDAFAFAPFIANEIYADYHGASVRLLADEIHKHGTKPRNLLEIGSSLGRTFYEVCRSVDSLKSATLVEPSQNLFGGFNKIFSGGETETFPVLKGFSAFHEVKLKAGKIRASCQNVQVTALHSTFQELSLAGHFDLVICSNVIDQCKNPRELAEVLKGAVAPGGMLLLSCTYQWQHKYTGNAVRLITNIQELFGPGWRFLNEANIPFRLRANERQWLGFLSHAVVYLKN